MTMEYKAMKTAQAHNTQRRNSDKAR